MFGEIAYNIIAPIFIVIGISFVVDRTLKPDPRGLSRLVVYLFTPFLVLDGLANSDMQAGEAGKLIVVATLMTFGVALVAWGVAHIARFERRLASAFILSSVLINAGNYGIPLNEFAFGADGEDRALIFFVATVVLSNTLGVYLASLGSAPARRALVNVLLVPLPYAAVLGLGINAGGIDLPVPLERSVTILSDAAIPAMLVVLGIQLSRATVKRDQFGPILLASGMRLIVAPLIALPLVVVFGMSGVTRDVALVQSAMPTAVISGVLATEFGSDAEFVTSTILVSTLLSMATLSVLLSILM